MSRAHRALSGFCIALAAIFCLLPGGEGCTAVSDAPVHDSRKSPATLVVFN